MNEVYVNHLSYALGEECYSVREAEQKGWIISPAAQLETVGFKQHHVCGPTTNAYALAKQAIQPIQEHLTDVNSIIYATCLPCNSNIGDLHLFEKTRDVKYLMDFPVSHLQADLGLGKAMVLALNQQACTSILTALCVARLLILTEAEIQKVLCVTADRFPEGALYEHAYNLISDGAAACLVSTVPQGFRLIACHAITNGALAQASDDEIAGSFFSYSYQIIRETLEKANMTMKDLHSIVSQNVNQRAVQILAHLLGIPYERFYFPTLGYAGHVTSADNILNLKHLQDSCLLKSGERVLLFTAAYGMNWQSIILEKA